MTDTVSLREPLREGNREITAVSSFSFLCPLCPARASHHLHPREPTVVTQTGQPPQGGAGERDTRQQEDGRHKAELSIFKFYAQGVLGGSRFTIVRRKACYFLVTMIMFKVSSKVRGD